MITHPKELITSEDFKELSKEAASNFLSRIQYIAEIRDNLTLWLKGEANYDYQSLGDFLTDLELDAIVNQGTPAGEAEKCVSNWLVHSSWGDELVIFSPKNVDDEIINLIEQPLPSVFLSYKPNCPLEHCFCLVILNVTIKFNLVAKPISP